MSVIGAAVMPSHRGAVYPRCSCPSTRQNAVCVCFLTRRVYGKTVKATLLSQETAAERPLRLCVRHFTPLPCPDVGIPRLLLRFALRVIEMRTRRLPYAILPLAHKIHLSCRGFLRGRGYSTRFLALVGIVFSASSPPARYTSAA